ncbi:MAG: MtrAB system histidine kinase MtrB [Actinomycetes bacterium]
MFINKLRLKQSLGLRVLVTNILFVMLAVVFIGISVYTRVSSTVINEKIAISKVETQNALMLAQGHFDLARFQNDAELRNVVNDFITSSREDGSLSGRETVLLRIPNSGPAKDIYQTVPTLLSLDSIPQDFRDQVLSSDKILDIRSTIKYSNGVSNPGFILGGKLKIPRSGDYAIYYLFNLEAQYQTINSIAWSLVFFGLLLVLLIGAITRLLIRQVVSPVTDAAAVAEKFTAGDLTTRMQVKGEDELASLGRSFNEMASSLQQQIYRLQNLSQLQQRFVSDVSHELRTPLTTMRMAAEIIHDQRSSFEDPSLVRSAELLINQIDRFELLLSDLLEVSRFDANEAMLDFKDFDLTEVIRKTIDYLHPTKIDQFEINIPTNPVMVDGDPRRIERILRNLVANAIDHSEGKNVKIELAESENEVAVSVRDFGLGFNESDASKLFDRFWRADPSRARTSGGTGLGLSIALEDAKLHHGELLAWGKPNEGAHFVLTLPKRSGDLIQTHPIFIIPSDLS